VGSIDYIETSIGTLEFKPLTNGILNKALIYSTIKNDVLNYHLFYSLLELKLLKIKKKQWRSLSPADGLKTRDKLKEILQRHGVLEYIEDKKESSPVAKQQNLFSEEERAVFEQQSSNIIEKTRGIPNGSNS